MELQLVLLYKASGSTHSPALSTIWSSCTGLVIDRSSSFLVCAISFVEVVEHSRFGLFEKNNNNNNSNIIRLLFGGLVVRNES